MKKEHGLVEGLVIRVANWVSSQAQRVWSAIVAGWNWLLDKTQPQRTKAQVIAQVAKAKVEAATQRLNQARPALDAALDVCQIALANAWAFVAPKVGRVLGRIGGGLVAAGRWLKDTGWAITVSVAWQIVVADQRAKAKQVAGKVYSQRKAA